MSQAGTGIAGLGWARHGTMCIYGICGSTPPPETVANEGLVGDFLLKM